MIVSTALLLFAQAAPAEAFGDCTDPQAQQEMNWCAAQDFASANAALDEQWALTVAAMRRADAATDRTYDDQPGHYETLLEGQRAWLAYRDAQCRSESFAMRGGSMQPLIENSCKAYMTELRIQQLRDLSAGPE